MSEQVRLAEPSTIRQRGLLSPYLASVTGGAVLLLVLLTIACRTGASLMLRAGINPRVVSERLGHATVSITLDTYSHVLPTPQEKATGDLNAWLAGRG